MSTTSFTPTTSSVINEVLTELYLQGPEDKINEILQGQVTMLIQHQTWNAGDFFIGICSGDKWDNNKIICAVQIEKDPARQSAVIAMGPKNSSNVRGYAVIDFKVPDSNGTYPDYDISAKGVKLDWSVKEEKNWPIIYTWLRTDGIFCSSSSGNDNWPGTNEYPVKTIVRALEKANHIFLRSGDTFYEKLKLSGVIIESYGAGVKPRISGLMKIKSNSWVSGELVKDETGAGYKWKNSSTGNIWMLDLTNKSRFDGFKTGVNDEANNIGTIINCDTGLPCNCLRCDDLSQLSEVHDFDYMLMSTSSNPDFYHYLFLRLDNENPNNLNLGLSVGATGIDMQGSEISGVEIRDWGIHGLVVDCDSKVDNCTVCSIGGSGVKSGNLNALSYGNGIQVWFKKMNVTKNILITGCIVRNCYDAGITMQGKYNDSDPLPNARNIIFCDNTVSHCGYGFEFFNSKDNTAKTTYLENCIVSKCKFVSNGIATGFRYQNQGYDRSIVGNGHLRFWNDYPTGSVVEDCTFINGNFLAVKLNVVEGEEPVNPAPFRSVILRRNYILLFPSQYLMGTTPQDGRDGYYCYAWKPINANSVMTIFGKYKTLTQDATSTLEFDYANVNKYVTPVIIRPS